MFGKYLKYLSLSVFHQVLKTVLASAGVYRSTLLMIPMGLAVSCGGSSGGGRSQPAATSQNPVVVTEEDPPAPEETPSEDPLEDPGPVFPGTVTVTPTTGFVAETADTPENLKIFVQSTQNKVDYKHRSEFLLMLRATEDSCVNLRVRPGGALEDSASGDAEDLSQACLQQGVALRGVNSQTPTSGDSSNETESSRMLGLNLASPAVESSVICDQRNFRTEIFATGIDPERVDLGDVDLPRNVVATYGTLVAKSAGNKVKVWIDANYAEATQLCTASVLNSQTPGSTTPYRSGQNIPGYAGFGDALLSSQLQTLADMAEKILTSMSEKFGDITDVDKNGAVNIFISPYINRMQFRSIYTKEVDTFQAMPIYREKDLFALSEATNPGSNEGEVIYLWSPSPGGETNYEIYPSSNSLNTNYAYGYVAYQLMGLILSKAKLLDQQLTEARFLRESLSYLASIYYAGGAYSWREISHYLTSFTPYISLTENLDLENFKGPALAEGVSGQLGLRALFGWYLHINLCGIDSLEPCARVKDLITGNKVGIELLEATLGLPFAKILSHFSASVMLGLLEKPTEAYTLADNSYGDKLPNLFQLKHFQELNVTATENFGREHNSNLVTLVGTQRAEPAYYSPFPSKENVPFRIVSPNSDRTLKLQKNSFAYVILTGVVSEYTDISAYIGKGIEIAAIPLGERDSNVRTVYVESVAKDLSLDTRPVKLFPDSDPTLLPKNAQFIWETVDSVVENENFTVNLGKEVWISGEINNPKINVGGEATFVSDSDAYLIKVDPCATNDEDGGGASTITGCTATDNFQVLVQVYIDPVDNQLDPVLAVTPQDRRAYHGAMVWPERQTVDVEFEPEENELVQRNYMCNPGVDSDDGVFGGTPGCQGGDMPLVSSACNGWAASDSAPRNECFQGEQTGMTYLIDGLMELGDVTNDGTSDYGFDFTFDNFLYLGNRFPLDTTDTIEFFQSETDNIGVRMFTEEEKDRMFYNFTFSSGLKPEVWFFHPTRHGFLDRAVNAGIPRGVQPEQDWSEMSDEDSQNLAIMRNKIYSVADGAPDLAADDLFLQICAGFNIDPDVCAQPCDNAALVSAGVATYLRELDPVYVCRQNDTDNCPGKVLFQDYGAGASDPAAVCTSAANLGNFFEQTFGSSDNAQKRFLWVTQSDASYETYYRPTMPQQAKGDRCSGAGGAENTSATCRNFAHEPMGSSDIRNQFLLASDRVKVSNGCQRQVYPDAFGFCSDAYSYELARVDTGSSRAARFVCRADEGGLSDPTRDMKGETNFRAGEMIGLPNRIYPLTFRVRGDRATVLPLLIGGLNQSQGNYFIRVRTFKISECVDFPN